MANDVTSRPETCGAIFLDGVAYCDELKGHDGPHSGCLDRIEWRGEGMEAESV